MVLKIGFLGNCQAQTLDALSRHIGLGFEFVSFDPVWLYEKKDESRFLEQLNKCDLLFNQRISDDYGVDFLRTSVIKSQMGDKSFSWPNIYFDGYFPTISYIYTSRGKITGPLSDYHLPLIRKGWESGKSVKDVVVDITNPEGPLFVNDPVAASLAELSSREDGLDVKMSDFVDKNFRDKKLFFTPNHPYNEVLYELLIRLMHAANLAVPNVDLERVSTFPYTLSSIQIPIMAGFFKKYGGKMEQENLITGREISVERNCIGETEFSRIYNWSELTEKYFCVYDAYRAAEDL